MTSSLALEKKTSANRDPEEIYRWLENQSQKLGIKIVLYPEEARMDGTYFYIPAYLPDGKDPYDYAVKLQKFEDTWNDQEPRPNPPINLTPAKSPEQRSLWQRLWEARDHKVEAANAVAEAGSDREQQAALAELRTARREEIQAEEEYNSFYAQK